MAKKLVLLVLVLCLELAGSGYAAGSADYYADRDLSEKVNLVWYVLGDVPQDLDVVLKEANEKFFTPILNCALEVKFMSWSEYATKYSLILAGGEDCDMIYTASWCYFLQEGKKGAFYPLTEEFRSANMPMSVIYQAPESWEQVSIDNIPYAITRNYLTFPVYKFMAIREDLREKYALPEVVDFETFAQYMFTVAKNEPGMQAIAAPGNNDELRDILLLQRNRIYAINQNNSDFVFSDDDALSRIPDADKIEYLYSSDAFCDYALLMRDWAAKNCWSKNAINSTLSTSDAFAQGLSACLPWIDALFQYSQQLESAGLGTVKYVDITSDIIPRKTAYNGDCIAITGTSKNPGRAAMAIDLMMHDRDLNLLLYGGIEGVHYILHEGGTYSEGPEAEKYPWRNFAWPLENANSPQKYGRDPREIELVKGIRSREVALAVDSFVFDDSSLKAETAVLASLREEYRPSFDLGAFGDNTEAKLEEYKQKQLDAGLEKVMAEFRSQYSAYLANKAA